MKNLRKGALFLSLAFLLGSCTSVSNVPIQYDDEGMDLPWVDYNIAIKEVNFASGEDNITLYRNDASRNTHTYTYEVLPKNATNQKLNFKSSNEEIIAVDGDTITAVGAGTTTVIASVKDEEPKVSPITLNVTVNVLLEDFSVTPNENIVLDYNESLSFAATFSPADATDKNLTYTVEDESLLDVSGPTITAKEKEGTTKVIIAHASGLTKEVNVEVKDLTVHVESIDLAFENNLDNIEINAETKLVASVHPDNATHIDELEFNVEDKSIAKVMPDGTVVGLKEGTTKVYATCEGKESAHIDLTVYEVYATAISFGVDEIVLDNLYTPKKELTWTYTTDTLGKEKPSKEDVTFSSDSACVKVDNTGLVELVSSGTANVTISILGKDGNPVVDTVRVVATVHATAIVFNSSVTEMYKNEDLALSVSVTPSGTTIEHVTFNVIQEPENIATYDIDGNNITIHSKELGLVTIIASHGYQNVTKELHIIERPLYFEVDTDYIVGTADFSSGTSKGSEESWGNARLAYKMSEKEYDGEGKEDLVIQTYAQITFRAGDEFKVFNGTSEWVEIFADDTNHYHKEVENDAFTKGLLTFENGNVHVSSAGTYDIYHKLWKSGWHEVYIDVKPSMSVDKESINILVNEEGKVTVSNWSKPLSARIENENIAVIKSHTADGEYTIKGLVAGTTKITFTDAEKSVSTNIVVSETPVELKKTVYLNTRGIFESDGGLAFYHAWNEQEVITEGKMTLVEGQTIVYSAELPEDVTHIIFVRMAAGTETFNWDNKWNQSENLVLNSSTNMWTCTSLAGGVLYGDWSIFDPNTTYKVDDEPIETGTITVYFAGINDWWGVTGVHMSIGSNPWTDAYATYGDAAQYGQYILSIETSEDATSLCIYFENNNDQNVHQYYHPTSGSQDYNTSHSNIGLGGVGNKLKLNSTYVVTYTGVAYHYDNWEHVWFDYSVTKL